MMFKIFSIIAAFGISQFYSHITPKHGSSIICVCVCERERERERKREKETDRETERLISLIIQLFEEREREKNCQNKNYEQVSERISR